MRVNTEKKNLVDGRYIPREIIGSGGMGEVVKVYDTLNDKIVALKIIKENNDSPPTSDSQSRSVRFKREAQIGLKLRHPNIVQGYDIGNVGKTLYFTMEFVQGISLKDELKRCGTLNLEKSINIVLKVLDALGYAHKEGIVHRDIKPGNIVLDSENTKDLDCGEPKIADFGIAKLIGDNQIEKVTLTSAILGSFLYMPPEQIGENKKVDCRSDVYSVGVLLHKMLAGITPFSGEKMQVITQKTQGQYKIHQSIPMEFQGVIKKCLEKDPKDRYQDTKELSKAIAIAQGGMGIETISSSAKDLAKRRRRERRESRQYLASQSSPKHFYALAISFLAIIVLGIALFAQMQHYENIIKQKQEEVLQSVLKAKNKMEKANKDKAVVEKNLKKVKLDFDSDLAKKKQEISRLKLIFERNNNFTTPEGFVFLRQKIYTCAGKSNLVREYKHDSSGIIFVFIPGGKFMMGNTRNERESPIHEVIVFPFLISQTEITQKTYVKFMGDNPSFFRGENLPVEQVTWKNAKKFCTIFGFDLPSESQWEYACRANTDAEYFWGNNFEPKKFCWYKWNSRGKTHPVAKKMPNAFGLYDMLGNVWEWCEDDFNFYITNKKIYNEKVNRGGHFNDPPESLYCSHRNGNSGYRYKNKVGGFRVVFNLK